MKALDVELSTQKIKRIKALLERLVYKQSVPDFSAGRL